MTDTFVIQIALLALFVGIIIGSIVTANIYSHRIALKEAEESGRKEGRKRLAPPPLSAYERMLRNMNALANNDKVEDYTVHAYGETFTFKAAKEEE